MSNNLANISLLLYCQRSTPHLQQVEYFLQTVYQLQTQNNPDLHFLNVEGEPLQIETVRELAAQMVQTPYQFPQSVFVIFQIQTASLPAQNALLKSLEEPPAHVQIILTTDQPDQVLPTIRSRCVLKTLELKRENHAENSTEIAEVFSRIQTGSFTDLFTISEKYKDREVASQFVETLIQFLHAKNLLAPEAATTKYMQKLLESRSLLTKNVNTRLVLEDAFFTMKTYKH